MRVSVGLFRLIPAWSLWLLTGPSEVDDRCLVTTEPLRDLPSTVRASDGRSYDARALRGWLRAQQARAAFVVPGCPIRHVDMRPWWWWEWRRARRAPPTMRRARVLAQSARSAFDPWRKKPEVERKLVVR